MKNRDKKQDTLIKSKILEYPAPGQRSIDRRYVQSAPVTIQPKMLAAAIRKATFPEARSPVDQDHRGRPDADLLVNQGEGKARNTATAQPSE